MAFGEIIKVIEATNILGPVNEILEPLGLTPLDGETALGIMLCLVEEGMRAPIEAHINATTPGGTAALPEDLINNILPNMSVEGIDFTGKLSGLLTIPPLPFGILYILLDLLKRDLANAMDGDGDQTETSGDQNLEEC